MVTADSTVTIIVAVLNEKDTLSHLLDSIKKQVWSQIEVIIMDGGSVDGTVELIKAREQDITYWSSGDDSGIYHAWNRALSRASGDYLCFLGADDLWANPDSLLQLMTLTGRQPDLVASRFKMHSGTPDQFIESGSNWSWAGICQTMNLSHRGLLHHHRLFSKFGKFDETYKIAGDYEFLLRCGNDLCAEYYDEVTVIAGSSGISMTKPFESLWERYRAQRTHKSISWPASVSLFINEYYQIKVGKFKTKIKNIIR